MTNQHSADERTGVSEIVHKYFADYVSRNKKAMEDALAGDFRISQPARS